NADGTSAQPLRYTVCTGKCPDPPYQIVWLQPNALLVLREGDILRVAPGSKPQKIARINDFSFVTNPTGTRIAAGAGSPSCLTCSGPVTILDAQSGALVGTAGGRKLDNVNPSLSPDGTRVVFELAVVDVAAGKVRSLLQLYYAPTAAWSSDSSELLANTVPKTQKCWSTWRVPADGSKPTLISSCST